MKNRLLQTLAPFVAATAIALVAGLATADEVISDTGSVPVPVPQQSADSGCSNCNSGSYVGDLPSTAGCSGGQCSAGGCSGGQCSAGGCDGGQCSAGGCLGGRCLGGRCLGGRCLGGIHSLGTHFFGCGGAGRDSGGMTVGRSFGRPDLFYNFYTQGNANQVNAQMYLSPLPIPPNVGHTFYTYQPFYPHEMLYWHKDRFHRYYDNGRGMNRTRAVYYSPPVRQAASNFYWNYLRLPR